MRRAGLEWTKEEDGALCEQFARFCIERAGAHERTCAAITSRIFDQLYMSRKVSDKIKEILKEV